MQTTLGLSYHIIVWTEPSSLSQTIDPESGYYILRTLG